MKWAATSESNSRNTLNMKPSVSQILRHRRIFLVPASVTHLAEIPYEDNVLGSLVTKPWSFAAKCFSNYFR
jgi:hypothetical protein